MRALHHSELRVRLPEAGVIVWLIAAFCAGAVVGIEITVHVFRSARSRGGVVELDTPRGRRALTDALAREVSRETVRRLR